MKLLEYKGKQLLQQEGIKIPPGIVVNNKNYINLSYHKEKYHEFFFDHQAVVIKAQIIAGQRGKNNLVVLADNYETSLAKIDELYNREFNGQPIDTLLIEKKLDIKAEYYLSITFDTLTRAPVILFSVTGGVDIESNNQNLIRYHPLEINQLHNFEARLIAQQAGFKGTDILQLANFIQQVYRCFIKFDCVTCEINPLIRTTDDVLYAGDAKITIDDSAVARQSLFADAINSEDKSLLSEREIEARKIDAHDHRGVAGKTYLDLEGDIAILASGGGASLICMDALLLAGGQPANYTEYSGNPPREKVKKLTQITLSKPGLNGCLVIGGNANFTDIFETLSGFAEGLLTINPKPDYPIIIRRGGFRTDEAFAMLKEFSAKNNFDISLYGETTPMTLAVKLAVDKINHYKNSKK